ncbi:MAG: recombinase family protein [Pseudomonadota bacterium]
MKRLRCAIYTRKSSEEGLEQEFNSLDAQREACAAYVASQKAEGWVLLDNEYDDGGLSGGTMDRPALQRLIADIDAGRVDQIVVYKIDRLTRSLADFAKIVERLDAAGASFVSVTQSFNTATSMGRLTLNMLLSFAQFEREVTAERIRDKIAASKKKGLWMGGQVPLGYDADGRTLRIRKDEAETVRSIYRLYQKLGTIREVIAAAETMGLRSRKRILSTGRVTGGIAFDHGHIHHILTNPLYAGRIRHRNEIYEGKHPAIIEPEEWEAAQRLLSERANRPRRGRGRGRPGAKASPLAGKIFDEAGDRLTPTHSKTRNRKRLRYYVSRRLIRRSGESDLSGWRLPAPQLESAVAELVQQQLNEPGFPARLLSEGEAGLLKDVSLRLSTIRSTEALASIVDRIDIAPGAITIATSASALAELLELDVDSLALSEALTTTAPFRTRRRGVETKLILGDALQKTDQRLMENIARANDWFDQLKAGRTYAEIAQSAGTSKRRVQQMIDLAFLAPDIVRAIVEGRQPVGLTSDWLLRHDLPSAWDRQRAIVATL